MALAGIYFVVYACKTFLRVHGGCDGAGGGLGGWHGGMGGGMGAWRRHGAGGHGRIGSQWRASDPAFLNGMSPSPIYPYGRLGCWAECWSSSAGERRRSWRLRRRAQRLAWWHGRGHGADAGRRGCGGAHHDAATAIVAAVAVATLAAVRAFRGLSQHWRLQDSPP